MAERQELAEGATRCCLDEAAELTSMLLVLLLFLGLFAVLVAHLDEVDTAKEICAV